jgi:hypothetical protein
MSCPIDNQDTASKDVNAAVRDIFRVLAAEHWARFYFAEDRDGAVFSGRSRRPPSGRGKDQPLLAEFLREINGSPRLRNLARCVGEFVFRNFEVSRYASGSWPRHSTATPSKSRPGFFLCGCPAMRGYWTNAGGIWRNGSNTTRGGGAASRCADSRQPGRAGNPETPTPDSVH